MGIKNNNRPFLSLTERSVVEPIRKQKGESGLLRQNGKPKHGKLEEEQIRRSKKIEESLFPDWIPGKITGSEGGGTINILA